MSARFYCKRTEVFIPLGGSYLIFTHMMQMLENPSLIGRLYRWMAQLVNKPSAVLVYVVVITLMSSFLRIYKLDEWSFWGDEMFSLSGSEDGFNYSPIRKALSLELIWAVTAAHGLNEWNARIVPALIGICTIPILFFIVRKLFDTPTALLAALLLALSTWHIYWSQNARFYAALLLFYTLAMFFFYWGMEHDKPWYLVLCLLFLSLAVKERLLAIFFIPIIMVYLVLLKTPLFEKPKGWRLRNLAILVLPGVMGSLLFAGPYLLNLPDWFSGFGFSNNDAFWLMSSFVFYVGIPVVILGGFGGLHLVIQKDRAGLLLCVSAVLPILILSAISPFHYTANRYAFISLTSWVALAAFSVTAFIKNTIQSGKLLSLGMLFVLLTSSIGENVLYYFYQNGNRENWRAAFSYVSQHRQPDDLVASGHALIADYYLSTDTTYFGNFDLDEEIVKGNRIWFIEDNASIQKFPALHSWLIENTQLVSVHDVTFQARIFSMRVYLYDPALRENQGN
jgi:hypothetical protein